MNASTLAAILIGVGLVIGLARTLRGRGRLARGALQAVAAVLLYLVLFPGAGEKMQPRGELVVLTAGATPAQVEASRSDARVALPGVDPPGDVERVPDLGAALRRHPDTRDLVVVGGGLPARDLDAARGRVSRFDAAPPVPGLAELETPVGVAQGGPFRVRGRIQGIPDARVELRDPASAIASSAIVDGDGRFALVAGAREAGAALFSLRVSDSTGRHREDVAVPVVARTGAPLRVMLFAGAPDPELKYLRRWALDAGLDLDSRITLSAGVALDEGAATLDDAALRATDVAILDQRAWTALSATGRAALLSAVDGGLGLLLRMDSVPEVGAAVPGFALRAESGGGAVALEHAFGVQGAPAFARAPVAFDARDAAVALRADDGTPLLAWRARGRGRIGVDLLRDSWKLVLAGHAPDHAGFWSATLETLGRARAQAVPALPGEARVGERVVLCGLASGASVEAPDGSRITLRIDPATGARHCAGYWPAQAGWNRLQSAAAREAFHVRAADEAPALAAATRARATRDLVGAPDASVIERRDVPRSRWPFFLAWFAVTGVLWWLERRARRTSHGPA
jgi:hypothetical protein